MTTDEATKSEGEVQAAALAERGEDITPSKDRGVLKVKRVLLRVSCPPALWGAWSPRWAASPALRVTVPGLQD